MLKRRIIPIELLIGKRLVKTIQFSPYTDVGDPVASSRVYNAQNADELLFLNIDRFSRTVEPLLYFLEKISAVCFMPLAVGGGIQKYEDVEILLKNGADKVVMNSICYEQPELIYAVSERFGSQSVIVSVDARWNQEIFEFDLYSDCGRKKETMRLKDHLEIVTQAGAGEILINSIDTDGMMNGYDLHLIREVKRYVRLPVIACGGAGNFTHLKEAFLETNVEAVACGSLFNFGDNNPFRAKAYLTNHNLCFKT